MLTHADVHWIELDSVDSTNDFLSRAYLQGRVSGPAAVLAREQTAGRGRAGRVWQAVPGSSLCLTLGLPMAGHEVSFLPLCVGVGLARALEKKQVPVRLKWPNDLLIGTQKLGGVLCESFQAGQGPVTLVGVGINMTPVPLSGSKNSLTPTSLSAHLPESRLPTTRNLAESCVDEIMKLIQAARMHGMSAIFQEFTQLDAWLGKQVEVHEQGVVRLAGTAMGIDSSGAYLLNTERGLCQVNAGDLSLRVAS